MNSVMKGSFVSLLCFAISIPAQASWLSDLTGINWNIPAGTLSVGRPDPGGAIQRLPQTLQRLPQDFANLANPAGAALAFAVRQAKAQALSGAQPMPQNLVAMLQPYFPADILQSVRYNTFSNARISLDSAVMMLNTDVAAITLEDVIVFRNIDDAQNGALWAHELTHVLQYRSRGVETFANTYTTNAWVLENEARDNASRVVNAINAQNNSVGQQQFTYFNVTGQLLAADAQGNLYPANQSGQIVGQANGRLYIQNGQYVAVDLTGRSFYAARIQ